MLHPTKTIFQKLSMPIYVLALLTTVSLQPLIAQAECGHGHWDQEKYSENFDKRMNALHDELALSESQQVAWQDFTVALTPTAHEAKHDRSEFSQLTTPERLDRMLNVMKLRQEKMASHIQSIESFYSTLTSEQQKIFDQKFNQHFQRQK